jgi:hypothetical protein
MGCPAGIPENLAYFNSPFSLSVPLFSATRLSLLVAVAGLRVLKRFEHFPRLLLELGGDHDPGGAAPKRCGADSRSSPRAWKVDILVRADHEGDTGVFQGSFGQRESESVSRLQDGDEL